MFICCTSRPEQICETLNSCFAQHGVFSISPQDIHSIELDDECDDASLENIRLYAKGYWQALIDNNVPDSL